MQPGIQQPGGQQAATTRCAQCGAELRSGARFCNRCGAPQPVATVTPSAAVAESAAALHAPAAPPPTAPQPTQQPVASAAPSVAEPPAPPAEEMDEWGRVKRPPRVPRMREDEETSEAQTSEDEGMMAGSAESAPDVTEPAAAPDGGSGMTISVHEQEMPSLPMADEAAQTVETTPPASASAEASAQLPAEPSPPVATAPGTPGETPGSLDWPLAAGTLVGGRYRVEMVLSAAQTPSDENVYRVSDRRGYEQCWSCGATYTPAEGEQPEEYCAQCGADMLARPYVMRERMLLGDDAAVQAPATGEQAATVSGARVFREAGREYTVVPEEIERSPFTAGVHVVIASASDTGRERSDEANEDSVAQLVLQTVSESYAEPLALGIVADGLGGHASGSEASRTVTHIVLTSVLQELVAPHMAGGVAQVSEDEVKQVLRDAVTAANAALHMANAQSQQDRGSTLVAALILGETAYIANIGDSRGYVYDGVELRRLTTDHSLVEQLIAGGMIAPEERYTHPNRNQIYRSLGASSGDDLTPDIFIQRLRPGMRLLLCSDGLWEMVHDDELAQILHQTPHPQGACDALIAAANANGGEDNISALLIDVTD